MLNKALFCLVLTMITCIPCQAQHQKTIIGNWMGRLDTGGLKIRIVFKISRTSDGALRATMFSIDQGYAAFQASKVILENQHLRIEVKAHHIIFHGKWAPGKKQIKGQFAQGSFSAPMVLKSIARMPAKRKPQDPIKPYPYREEEVIYQNKKAGIRLAGTLTLPPTRGPFPVVLFITGSGPQNRDEAILGHRPFLVLADYLTRLGLATLRVDDRGIGGSTGNVLQSTSDDFAGDVIAGLEYLKGRREVRSDKIGLLGHSEGAIIAPMVAARTSDVAFIVMLAGSGIPGEEILYLQAALIAKAAGANDKQIAAQRSFQNLIFSVVKQEKDNVLAVQKFLKLLQKKMNLTEEQAKAALAKGKQMFTPWYRFFLTYDPRSALRKVKCPVLVLNGEKDLQVPPKENLQAIEMALQQGGNQHYMIKSLPNLNHLFQTATTGAPSEYAKIDETIAPAVLKMIGVWIQEQIPK